MAEPQRLTITIDLGAYAPMSTLAAAIGDLDVVCEFAAELQRVHDRNEATYRVLRQPNSDVIQDLEGGPWPWVLWPLLEVPPRSVARAVSEDLQQRETDADALVTVERVTYRNPLELVILTSGVVTIAILKFLRDWRDRRRMTDAAATDYEDTVRTRSVMRRLVRESVEQGEFRLSREQVDQLLAPSTLDALAALTASDVTVSTESDGGGGRLMG